MTDQAGEPQQVLTDEILADARRQAERIRTRAGRDARQITDKARAQADADRQQRLAAAHDEADRQRQLTLATVPIEVARMRADKVEAALALATEAAGRLQGDAVVLELAAADAKAFGADLAEAVRRRAGRDGLRVSVAPEAADIPGGVVVRDAEGRQVWDNSLEGRLRRFWPALRRRIATHVAPEDAAAASPAPPSDEKES